MIDGLGRGAQPRMPSFASDAVAKPGIAPFTSAPAGKAVSGGSQIVRELAAKPPVDTARVEALRQAINAGNYKPDPDAIAAKMLSLQQGSRRA